MPETLSRAMNDAVIRRLAGAQYYQRGLDYLSHGHVESLEDQGDCVRAVVRGERDYEVTLASDEGVLDYSCDCPIGSDGEFCKHCVAAALGWLRRASRPASARRGKAREFTLADAGKVLREEDKDALVGMVLDWAKDDARLRERLILYAARRFGPDASVAAVRRAFEKAARVRDFMSNREVTAWARGVNGAIDSIEQLLDDGQAASVIELCESALQSLRGAFETTDDSDGHISVLRDRLQDIHHQACQQAPPDPADLARRLFQWELRGDFDAFYDAAAQYAKILGAKGLKVYRELAEAEWEKVPARTAEDDAAEWSRHFRLTRIMESMAKASGDVEQLVAVMSRDLSRADSYLRIAQVYREARQHEKALLWAEKGLKAFPNHRDPRLREFAAEEYHRRGSHDGAMKLIWAEFLDLTWLENYKKLERHAKKAGVWPEWRERALAEIRQRIAKAKEKAQRTRSRWLLGDDDHSKLVEIFLYEGSPEEAWREAQAGGCSGTLWLQLAAAREREHPEDAAPIYLRCAESAIGVIANGRYEEPVRLLVKAAGLMRRVDRGAEFVSRLEALRAKHRIKRNFVKLIEQKRQSLYLQ